jgi:hypothetical protein
MLEGSKVMLCGMNELGLFAGINAGCRTAEMRAAAHAYFNKDQRFFILQNQINLAEATTVIAGNEF